MIKLDPSKQRRIHNRKINTAVYEDENDTLIVEGSLEDRRFLESHRPSGEIWPPRTVHHMIIRMALHLPELTILDIEVEMPAVPHEACREVQACLAPVKGTRIESGFIARVRRLVDRKTGCTHLQTLLGAMAPAAFQGAWSARVSRPIDAENYATMARRLTDTCWVWRQDGPILPSILAAESDQPVGAGPSKAEKA